MLEPRVAPQKGVVDMAASCSLTRFNTDHWLRIGMDETVTTEEHWWDDEWARNLALFVAVWGVLLVLASLSLLVFDTAIYDLLT
jgi:hypothetical protein